MKKEEAVGESVVIGLLASFVYWLLLLVYDWKIWKSWCVGWWFIDSLCSAILFCYLWLVFILVTDNKPDYDNNNIPENPWDRLGYFSPLLGLSLSLINAIFGISKNIFMFEFLTNKISQLWMSIFLIIYPWLFIYLSKQQDSKSSSKESFREGRNEMKSAENKYFMDSFIEEGNAAENDKAKSTLDEKTARWNQHNEEARIRREKQINAEKKRQSEIDRVFGIQKELEEGEYN
jgi:hypothetical protein